MIEKNVDIIKLNDQNLSVKCIIDGNNTSFVFDDEYSFLSKFIKVDDGNIYLGLKKIGYIVNNVVTITKHITTTEVRLLRAIYNNMVANHMEDADFDVYLDDYDRRLKHSVKLLNRKDEIDKEHKTELHTHFVEVLSSEELIGFLNKLGVRYPMNTNGEFDSDANQLYSYDEIVKRGWLDNLLNALRINPTEMTSFKILQQKIDNRSTIIKLGYSCVRDEALRTEDYRKEKEANNNVIKKYNDKLNVILVKISKLGGKISNLQKSLKGKKGKKREDILLEIEQLKSEKAKLGEQKGRIKDKIYELSFFDDNFVNGYLYNLLLDRSLDKLKGEDIEYSELSFSTANRIEFMKSRHKDDKSFNFLFSINRIDSENEYKKYSSKLEDLLNKGLVIGSDIMGLETPLNGEDYNSFVNKLEWIIPVLHIHPESILRIHASEDKDCTENMYKSLYAIKHIDKIMGKEYEEITGKKWGTIPPPRIRIGHGINIEKHPALISLIKSLGVVVEFNISSNLALSNISDLSNLPLQYYVDNDIPYTISTDGGGMYTTSVNQELNIFHNLVDEKTPKKKEENEGPSTDNNGGSSNNGGPDNPPEETNNPSDDKPNGPTEEDKEALKKFMDYKAKHAPKKVEYHSFKEALVAENRIYGTSDDRQKVLIEVNKLRRYVMDKDIDYDFDTVYFNNYLKTVLETNKFNPKEAKVYLYSFEKDIFPNIDISLKTVEYVDSKSNYYDNNMMKDLKHKEDNNTKIIDETVDEDYDTSINFEVVNSYLAALEQENRFFKGVSEKQKVVVEYKRFKDYLSNYSMSLENFSEKVEVIKKRAGDGTDFAKAFLYFLEEEVSPGFETGFKTMEYLKLISEMDDIKKSEKALVKAFEIVREIYSDYGKSLTR